MPYDSNGNFTLVDSYFVENGDTVLPVQHNPPLEDIATALSGVLLRSGAAPMSGDLKMGGKKVTGMADGVASSDAVSKGQLDQETPRYLTKSGSYAAVAADNAAFVRFTAAGTLSLPAAATLGSGWWMVVIADGGAVTIDPNASETIDGATTLIIPDGRSLMFICDGAAFQTDKGKDLGPQPFIDVASAATANIGAVASQNVRITGTTTITSFGTAPVGTVRRVRFAASLTLTYNATSLNLPRNANIVTAADDTLVAISLGSGNWFVAEYNFNVAANERSALGFIPQYISPNQTITLNSVITLTHGLGAVPDEMDLLLVCTTAELGYSVNERTRAVFSADGQAQFGLGANVSADATSLRIIIGVTGINVLGRTSRLQEAITLASWRLIGVARRNV